MKKNWIKTNQKDFRVDKVIKRKCDKLYGKWKGYNNSFNSWTDENDIVYFSKPKPLQGNLEFELDYPNSLDKKTNNIFSTMRFNHTMIFFKLTV